MMYGIDSFMPHLTLFAGMLPVLIIWSLFWKGLALWHSARRGEWVWFVVMLVINTVGILEIVYLFAVAKVGFNGLFKNGHSTQTSADTQR